MIIPVKEDSFLSVFVPVAFSGNLPGPFSGSGQVRDSPEVIPESGFSRHIRDGQ
jgi:hypothetical protein